MYVCMYVCMYVSMYVCILFPAKLIELSYILINQLKLSDLHVALRCVSSFQHYIRDILPIEYVLNYGFHGRRSSFWNIV
jgi:hypothetical protein